MFYRVEIKDHIRVPPIYFGDDRKESVAKSIRQKYEGRIDQNLGIVVEIDDINEVGQGKIIPGDGASYFETVFSAIVFRPELQEVCVGKIKDITDFGAFITLGPIEGMIHISQTMDDFVSFSKEKVLTGRDSKRVLKVGDVCRARCVAVSFKDLSNPKIGLTMRQAGLGKIEWLAEEEKK
ncbi:DNA-directed RNA polymerase [Candidatus Woesearchaeota archaeon]|nr:DNA-directed RNA polymerase [Candidatus Woesearchaeota archaeon]